MRNLRNSIRKIFPKAIRIVLVALVFSQSIFTDQVSAAWYNGDWAYREKITIPASEINGDLSNFPVYLNLADMPNDFFSNVNGTGADIRMTIANGDTETPFELVSIDTANAHGELWFKAPLLSSSSDTDFFIYYGNNNGTAYADTDTYGTHNVWTQGYEAVYHMNEDPTGNLIDSTSNSHNGTSAGSMTSSDLVDGHLGNSISFDGTDDVISLGSNFMRNGDFAIGAWFRRTTSPSAYEGIVSTGNPYNANGTGYVLRAQVASDGMAALLNNGRTSGAGVYKLGELAIDSKWHKTFLNLDRDNLGELYVDDSSPGTSSISAVNSSFGTSPLYIAGYGTSGTYEFKGEIDFVEISSGVRSKNWINTEYLNQSSAGNFYLIENGNSGGFDSSYWSNSHKITVSASEINGDLDDFPVYLNLKDLPSSFFSTVNGSGADIRITNGDQMTQLAFELVDIDTNNGTGELWFKADHLSSSTDTDFYLWYGNANAEAYTDDDEFGAHSVWEDYLAVYHFSNAPVNGTVSFLDSSANQNHGTPRGGMVAGDLVEGKFGTSYDFLTSNSEVLQIPGFQLGKFNNGSLSAWVNQESFSSPTSLNTVFDFAGTGGQGLMLFVLNTGTVRLQIHNGNSFQYINNLDPEYDLDKWNFLSSSWSNQTKNGNLLVNSRNVSQTGRDFIVNGDQAYHYVALHSHTVTSRHFDGFIDEIKISESPRSLDWSQTEFSNQQEPGNFYLVDNGDHAGFDSSYWGRSHKITILASEVNGDLNDFPVYVDISHFPDEFFSNVDSNGADIRITTNDQITQVAFELVSLDIGNGSGELWFKAPFLSSTTDTDFYLWYDNATAVAYDRDDEFGSENVWTDGYVAVYHMNDDPSAAKLYDSTKYRNDGNGLGTMTASDLVNGSLGKAISFDGTDDRYEIDDDASIEFFDQVYFSAWIHQDSSNSIGTIITKDGNTGGDPSGAYNFYVTPSDIRLENNNLGGSNSGVGQKVNDTWQYLGIDFQNGRTSEILFYFNGANFSSGSMTPFTDLSTHMLIGRRGFSGSPYYYLGLMDEIHMTNKNRSADWIAAEYSNQNDAKIFYNIDNGHEDFNSVNWTNSIKITILASELNGDLSEMPVYLNIKDLPSSFFSTVQSDGRDIRITQGDQLSEVPLELVAMDTGNGEGELWFKAPYLSASSDNVFYLWYGNNVVQPRHRAHFYGSENVWSNGFAAVYHMNEDPSGTMNDSSSNRFHGTTNSLGSSNLVNGSLGKGIRFEGNPDYINLGSSQELNPSQFTISAWANTEHTSNTHQYIFSNARDCCGTYKGINLRLHASTRLLHTQFWNNGSYSLYGTEAPAKNRDYYFATSFDSTNVRQYFNGKQNRFGTTAAVVGTPSTYNSYIGTLAAGAGTFYGWEGTLDEVRVANAVRSADWLSSEYSNQKAPGNFYIIQNGDYAGFDQSYWARSHKITILASEVNGDVTDFPVFVDLSHLPGEFFYNVDSNGADIRMTTNDQSTQIPFELVDLDIDNGSGELWFKAPSLSSTVNSDFYLWYDNPGAEAYDRDDEFGSENVWSNGYVAVYHMNEDPTGTVLDSTSYQHHSVSINGAMTPSDLVDSHLGKAINFDGVDDYVSIASTTDIAPTDAINMSVWHQNKGTGTTGTRGILVSKYANYVDRCGPDPLGSLVINGTQRTLYDAVLNNCAAIDEWRYFSLSFNGSIRDIYANGGNRTSDATYNGTLATYHPGTNLYIGTFTPTTYNTNGPIDEVHIANKARSDNWVIAEYANQNGAVNFYDIDNGHENAFNPANWSNSLKITIPGSRLNGDLSEIPYYVNFKDLPSSFFGVVQSDGRDIRVTQGDQLTEVPLELVSLDTVNGEGELWFKAPYLSASSDNVFYLWYGSSIAQAHHRSHDYGSENVWSNGFIGVYHFNEDPILGSINDSTGNRFHGTPNSLGSSNFIDSYIGKGINFEDFPDYIHLGNDPLLNPKNFTFSAWASQDEAKIMFLISNNRDCCGAYNGSDLSVYSGNQFRTSVWNGTASTKYRVISAETDYYLTGSFDGTYIDMYLNGNREVHSSTSGRVVGNVASYDRYIGRMAYGSSYNWDGPVDEVRMADKARSVDWVATEFLNQKTPGNSYLIENGDHAGFDEDYWSRFRKITVLASELNGDLTDFPVYVDLSDFPPEFFSNVDSNGADIRMTTNDQVSQVAFELVAIDSTNGSGELWFKAPFLSSTTDTDFYLWYSNPTAVAYDRDDEFGSENVWTDGYVAVYHMNEDPTGAVNDSTSNLIHGTSAGGMSSADLTSGPLGNSINFDGSGEYINLGNNSNLDILDNLTLSTWLQGDVLNNGYVAILSKYAGGQGWDIVMNPVSLQPRLNVRGASSIDFAATGLGSSANDTWEYLSFTANASMARAYENGSLTASQAGTWNGIAASASDAYIANRAGVNTLIGRMDEVHIAEKLRNADWIDSEYINQNDASEFYDIDGGIEDNGDEAWVSSDWDHRIKIVVNSNLVNGSHTDFPVYVDLADLPGHFFSNVNSDGSDIRVTAADGQTLLALEVVDVDTALNRGEIHFKAPLITDTVNTPFYIYYGNVNGRMMNGAAELGSQNVWTNGYEAVYHMHEDPSQATSLIFDSTANKHHGTVSGSMTLTDLVNGQLGEALEFDGSDDFINLGQLDDYMNGNSAISITVWTSILTHVAGAAPFVSARSGSTNQQYWFGVTPSGQCSGVMGFRSHVHTAGGQNHTSCFSSPLNLSTWYYLGMTYDDNDSDLFRIFLDGNIDYSATHSFGGLLAATTANTMIARYGSTYNNSIIDEVRISTKARSEEWMWTEYNNQSSPSTFYSLALSEQTKTELNNPKVVKLIPPPKSIQAPRRHPLRMLFDKVVNVLNGDVNIYQENGNIFENIDINSGQVTGGGSQAIIITPSTYFTEGASYYVLIENTALEDTSNNPYQGIADPGTWRFTIQGRPEDSNPIFIFDGMI